MNYYAMASALREAGIPFRLAYFILFGRAPRKFWVEKLFTDAQLEEIFTGCRIVGTPA